MLIIFLYRLLCVIFKCCSISGNMNFSYDKYAIIILIIGVFFSPSVCAQANRFKVQNIDFNSKLGRDSVYNYFFPNLDTSKMQSTVSSKNSLSERGNLTVGKDTIILDVVQIFAKKKFNADSIAFREEYKKVFNYETEKFKIGDLFIKKSPQSYNSTSSLVSINLLGLVSLLGNNKDKNMERKNKFIKYEKERSLDNKFSRSYFENLTKLEGDSLDLFIKEYKWKLYEIEDSEYEQILYIKESLKKYRNVN